MTGIATASADTGRAEAHTAVGTARGPDPTAMEPRLATHRQPGQGSPSGDDVRLTQTARRLAAWAAVLAFAAPSTGLAQTANDDFDPNINNVVNVIEQQRNGELLVGGSFTVVAGVTRNRVARVFSDGRADPAFHPNVGGATAVVRALHQQPGNRILIGGRFTQVGGQPRANLARINNSGSLDAAFDVAVDNDVLAIDSTLSPDGLSGMIYIGGQFANVQGQPRARVARLNAAGALDTGFVPPAFNGQVNLLRVDPAGGVIVGGSFSSPTSAKVFRLSQVDGSLDNGFMPTVTTSDDPFGNVVIDVALQPNGKLLIAGEFDTVNGQSIAMIARLNTNGTVDTSFDPPMLNGAVQSIDLQPDGRMVIGGDFTNVTLRNRVARLNADGSLDSSFAPALLVDDTVNAVKVLGDGGVAIAGRFTQLSGVPRNRMARLSPEGAVDQTLATSGATNGTVEAIAFQGDGRLFVGGRFTEINGVARSHIARLGPTGFVEGSFAPTISGDVYALAALPDGKVIAGGGFSGSRPRLARFLANGTIDTTFNAQIAPNGFIRVIAVQPDGRIVIGGSFVEVGGQPRAKIARLLPDGALDPTFNPAIINDTVRAIVVQPDGRLVIGGDFTSVGSFQRDHLARLTANGQFDTSFSDVATTDGTVAALALQSSGDILVGGTFQTLAGGARSRIGAVNSSGVLRNTFTLGADATVNAFAIDRDQRVYVGGSFTTIGGSPRSRLVLLNANGSLNSSFSAGTDGEVETLLVQPDGKLTFGGDFAMVGPLTRGSIARFGSQGPAVQSIAWTPSFERIDWIVDGAGPDPVGAPQVLVSAACCAPEDFVPSPGDNAMERNATGWQLEGFPALAGTFYVRIRSKIGDANGSATGTYDSPAARFDGGPPVADETDLVIAKSADVDEAEVGDTVEFTLLIQNLGPDAASGVEVIDQLPAGFTYVAHQVSQGAFDPGTGVWTAGVLGATGPGALAVMTIETIVAATGPYINVATLSGDQFDPVLDNNDSSVEITVTLPPIDDTIFANGFEQSP
jgi:uncharacterized repeat protein (TIGR01451 family)/uncharacterized delta-60 repeat protein